MVNVKVWYGCDGFAFISGCRLGIFAREVGSGNSKRKRKKKKLMPERRKENEQGSAVRVTTIIGTANTDTAAGEELHFWNGRMECEYLAAKDSD